MRYLIAMLVAIVVTLLVTVFVSPQLASMAVDRFTFESPDEVGNLEDGVYMLSNLVALLIGWGLGWLIGGRLVSPPPPPA
jgi:vancomycin permeability regulator SanA